MRGKPGLLRFVTASAAIYPWSPGDKAGPYDGLDTIASPERRIGKGEMHFHGSSTEIKRKRLLGRLSILA